MQNETTATATFQNAGVTIEIEQLTMMPYLAVLTYPKPNLRVARSRIKQLSKLGVKSITFEGRTKIGRLGLVGIGTVGLVVKASAGAEKDGEEFALKIRRTDANRESMFEEFRMTQLANRLHVGAPVYRCTRDAMLMRYVKGVELDAYLKMTKGPGTASKLRELCHSLLNQCRKLDLVGLDHGQLSDLRKHVIIDGQTPNVIDFESASQKRKPKNVTTAAQYLFVGSRLSPKVRRILGIKDVTDVLAALRAYKREMSDRSYVMLLKTFNVRI